MTRTELERLVERITAEVLGKLEGQGYRLAPAASAPRAGPPDLGTGPRRLLVAGNWKMNPCRPDLATYVATLAGAPTEAVDTLLLPPAVLLGAVRAACDGSGLGRVEVGAQDLHPEAKGAHTGEHSGALLFTSGARFSLVGHSERRQAGEDDGLVARKIKAGWAAGLSVMLCVGESLSERRTGATFRVLRQQMMLDLAGTALGPPSPHRLAVAYEPVWAIGTGERASPAQIQEACAFLRRMLAEIYDHPRARAIRVVYGGSVTPENAGEVMSLADVDGVLVGGASLDGRSFAEIVSAGARAAAAKAAAHTRRNP